MICKYFLGAKSQWIGCIKGEQVELLLKTSALEMDGHCFVLIQDQHIMDATKSHLSLADGVKHITRSHDIPHSLSKCTSDMRIYKASLLIHHHAYTLHYSVSI